MICVAPPIRVVHLSSADSAIWQRRGFLGSGTLVGQYTRCCEVAIVDDDVGYLPGANLGEIDHLSYVVAVTVQPGCFLGALGGGIASGAAAQRSLRIDVEPDEVFPAVVVLWAEGKHTNRRQ